MKKQSILISLLSIPFLGISQLFTPGAGVTDIDGNTYQTIIINGQEWMSENLRTSKYANGDSIPNITDGAQWANLTTGAWAHINNDSLYENPYGNLYNWYAVDDSRKLCPTGLHVPTYTEYEFLIDYLGGVSVAGGKMKSNGTQYWESPNEQATNESGFSGLPSGYRGNNGEFSSVGGFGHWWSSSEGDANHLAGSLSLYYFNGLADLDNFNKRNWISVRCLKNSTTSNSEKNPTLKTLIRIIDIMGNETIMELNKLQFYLYSDGSVEKKIVIEE